jgi:hypothetical protein
MGCSDIKTVEEMKLTRQEKKAINKAKWAAIMADKERDRLAKKEDAIKAIEPCLAMIKPLRVGEAFFLPSAYLYKRGRSAKKWVLYAVKKMFDEHAIFIVQTRMYRDQKGVGIWRVK